MENSQRHYTLYDDFLMQINQGLKSLFAPHRSGRENPADAYPEADLSQQQRNNIAGLMRVNHAGEISAQALYLGQALTARLAQVREAMNQSAQEEIDHLNWCAQRLQELESTTSKLNILWYIGSLTIGAFAGVAGDRWSLGFIVETERQVVKHLNAHLKSVPTEDHKTHAILQQMRDDEAHHATVALGAGASELPDPIKKLMAMMSRVMTSTSYWI